MKLKVCGLASPGNILEVIKLQPDFIGFIFYEKSPRFAGKSVDPDFARALPPEVNKVGVFVNAGAEYIKKIVKGFSLGYVQLHGDESPEFCREIGKLGVKVIKAFGVNETFDFSILENYQSSCDYFLFDTKGRDYGGNGITFDWEILNRYHLDKPYFLSGGIDLENIGKLSNFTNLKIFALDVNSRFEVEPGLKDIIRLQKLNRLLDRNNQP